MTNNVATNITASHAMILVAAIEIHTILFHRVPFAGADHSHHSWFCITHFYRRHRFLYQKNPVACIRIVVQQVTKDQLSFCRTAVKKPTVGHPKHHNRVQRGNTRIFPFFEQLETDFCYRICSIATTAFKKLHKSILSSKCQIATFAKLEPEYLSDSTMRPLDTKFTVEFGPNGAGANNLNHFC
ncbi:hypothetical protein PGUG_01713 [Meyerozyma guilliermondii ATCC 6260]|uniref:Uncharacterized protein n=1 Tax=Meyerozyma guilliermondii (strain ATCC 6260 / CBS 566 / DSM 6381 / JCM 1539 / NBRC 10279 / NRRL Y-324) TaxID=294746 RepID=A5DEL2_PICGU|nr:uncharacterized protein PGUG_01713 [Meyerozyma guilliermondii ATCC 6260]EDK37614.2 hypothetical protein PGUG_01713 [Meyerozyma guilliermondii ATCC 6260]